MHIEPARVYCEGARKVWKSTVWSSRLRGPQASLQVCFPAELAFEPRAVRLHSQGLDSRALLPAEKNEDWVLMDALYSYSGMKVDKEVLRI